MVAFATEVSTKDKDITMVSMDEFFSLTSNSYDSSTVVDSKSWTNIATSTTGFNCNVKVRTRVFECGSDVYKIQAKCVSGGVIIGTSPTTDEPRIQ